MSIEVQVLPLEHIKHLSLAQCIKADQAITDNSPLICLFTDTALLLDNNCQCLHKENTQQQQVKALDNNTDVELIVFHDIKISVLRFDVILLLQI